MIRELANLITTEHVTTLALLLFLWALGYSLYRTHKSATIQFNLLDLIMEGGRVSKVSVIIMCAFVVHTWVVVTWTLAKTITDQGMLTYAGVWVTPLLARMAFGSHNPSNPPPDVPTLSQGGDPAKP
jgi:hypothetical protein